MKPENLTDEQLIELAKIRLRRDPEYRDYPEIKTIEVEMRHQDENELIVSFLIEPEGYAKQMFRIRFSKFYPEEFLYLKEQGVEIENM